MQSSGCGLVDRVLVYHVCRLRVHPQQTMNHVWWCILKKYKRTQVKVISISYSLCHHIQTHAQMYVCIHALPRILVYILCVIFTHSLICRCLCRTHSWLCIIPLSVYTPLILMHRQTKYTDILGRGLYEKRGMGK